MTDVEHWIHQQVDFCSLMHELELLPLKIIWSDDVAINTAPTALLADLAALIAQVEKQFAKRGFDLNFGHGKTNIVVTFKGNQAPAFRKQYLHCDKPGLECALENGKRQCVPFVIMYKHLGVMFAPSQAQHMSTRTPGACNRHLPLKTRARLFQTLIATRMFYGLGAWKTPTLRQMKSLRQLYFSFLGRILRDRSADFVSNHMLLARTLLALGQQMHAFCWLSTGSDMHGSFSKSALP